MTAEIQPAETLASSARPKLGPIFLTVFVDVLALTFMYPLLPYYAESFGASASTIGLLFATFSFCQFLSGPYLGRLSDRYGRKPILVASQVGTLFGLLMLAFANRIEWLFAGRILDGLTAGNLTIAQAYITDATRPEERTRAYGFFGISFGVGFLVGPALSGIVADRYGYDKPALIAAGLSLLSIVLSTTRLEHRRLAAPPQTLGILASVKRVLAMRAPRTVILKLCAYILSFSMLMGGLALFLKARFGYDVKQAGYAFAFSGLMGAIAQGGIGRLAKRLGEHSLSLGGLVVMIVGFFALAAATTIPLMFVALAIGGLGSAVVRPALTTLLTGSVPEEERAVTLGVSQSATSLAQAIGPAIAGVVLHRGALAGWALIAAAFAGAAILGRGTAASP